MILQMYNSKKEKAAISSFYCKEVSRKLFHEGNTVFFVNVSVRCTTSGFADLPPLIAKDGENYEEVRRGKISYLKK